MVDLLILLLDSAAFKMEKIKGIIDLTKIMEIKSEKNYFQAVTLDRTYYFWSPNESEVNAWVSKLKHAVQRAQHVLQQLNSKQQTSKTHKINLERATIEDKHICSDEERQKCQIIPCKMKDSEVDDEFCLWTGPSCALSKHLAECPFRLIQ